MLHEPDYSTLLIVDESCDRSCDFIFVGSCDESCDVCNVVTCTSDCDVSHLKLKFVFVQTRKC